MLQANHALHKVKKKIPSHFNLQVHAQVEECPTDSYHRLTALISASKIIFLLVAVQVLCFGFRMKIMLIAHWCFSFSNKHT